MRLPDLNDLIQDLQLAKAIAIRNENVNGLINSVMSLKSGLTKLVITTINADAMHIES